MKVDLINLNFVYILSIFKLVRENIVKYTSIRVNSDENFSCPTRS
jgi:hypothetical protein